MESLSPTDRRQAWARTSRHRLTSDTLPDDDVFLEGCCVGKIETWLRGCGPEQGPEDPSHMTAESLLKASCSYEDDLGLGAEATELNIKADGPDTGYCPRLLPPPKSRPKGPDTRSSLQQNLRLPLVNLGHSTASSGLSSDTSKTASSVSEVLQLYAEDAEETLYQLGFGCEELEAPSRIPARFFNFPSQLRGINFRLFLESQLQRLREEDPGLSLASRFRQVEVLTAMANAFYSLYSHVSRTPLQKLAPPVFTFSPSPAESKIGERFFSSVRSEPRSPVERFKDTVSRMCLYTGPSHSRGSDSASPASPLCKCSSLSEVVSMVIGGRSEVEREREASDGIQGTNENSMAGGEEEKSREPVREGGVGRGGALEIDGERAAGRGLGRAHRLRALRQRWSGSLEFGSADPGPCSEPSGSLESVTSRIEPDTSFAPVPKLTRDQIRPKIRESISLAPFRCHVRASSTGGALSQDTPLHPSDCQRGSHTERGTQNTAADASREENKTSRDESGPAEAIPSDSGITSPLLTAAASPYVITVTKWEGDRPLQTVAAPDGVTPTSNQNYLSPSRTPSLGLAHGPSDPQANSFELEEVHSAGEEEPRLTDDDQMHGPADKATFPLAATKRHREVVLRGDSLQSDSSGYAEEDINPSSS
ncbi:hypothetical protein GJAV_G00169020 [Gymnothorax javanicus]|nr:hypothetical protein GJAV_G00169020 [Gymnothorax javanicus]